MTKIEQLKVAYKKGGTALQDRCKEYNLSLPSVLKKAQLEDWASPILHPIDRPPTPPLPAELALPPIAQGHLYEERMSALLLSLPTHLGRIPLAELLELAPKLDALDKVARRNFRLDREQQGGPTLNINILAQGIDAFIQPRRMKDAYQPQIIEENNLQL